MGYSHNFKKMIWTPDIPVGKSKFHCERCDSTVLYSDRLTEYEVNHLIAKAKKGAFPCVPEEEKIN